MTFDMKFQLGKGLSFLTICLPWIGLKEQKDTDLFMKYFGQLSKSP